MRLQRDKSLLLMVDFQAGLLPVIEGGEAAIGEAHWLLGVADMLEIPVWMTEQMPEKLGGTAPVLLDGQQRPTIWHKHHFAATEEAAFREALSATGRHQIVLCGTEAHICVLQTALGLLEEGYAVYWLSEATASRRSHEAVMARERACALGAQAVSADMVAYEWLHRCDTASFSAVHQQLLKPRAGKAVRFF
ncbi:isochorismatase family protein [Vreelandella arcis]|uniref:Isochorismatase family protein n=1 Tax=Vreelandella arcis TaxID=416873 RepID=A0A1H0I4I4_9GAMM|nr:isochorismatase family protein [Halomonas arcis]SDO26348.1 Isochorismatase family protein [Halomonas arcis]